MKVMILAGGYGTRISEESAVRPKPMIEIGNRPILWHIMKIYSAHGLNDFIVCCGYKGHLIKEYFAGLALRDSDVTFDLAKNQMEIHRLETEPWRVTLVETGENSMTGGRMRRAAPYLDGEAFCLTYGDGVSDIDITASIRFHRESGARATLTAVQPPGRYGAFSLEADQQMIHSFREKPDGDGAWINAGFFVLEPDVLDLIPSDTTVWEQEPLQHLAQTGQLSAYRHTGFWQAMDTLRDKTVLENLWQSGSAPWAVWNRGQG